MAESGLDLAGVELNLANLVLCWPGWVGPSPFWLPLAPGWSGRGVEFLTLIEFLFSRNKYVLGYLRE